MKKMKICSFLFVTFILFLACGQIADSGIIKSAEKMSPQKFNELFDGMNGVFKIYDIKNKNYFTFNEKASDKRNSPASTFKILHSLIALETKTIKSENEIRKWDGKKYDYEGWNQDNDLTSAVKYSVVWYFRQIAPVIGRERMQNYLDLAEYGNKKLGTNIDSFWLDNSLQISVNEQMKFITAFYTEELPFKKEYIKTVKKLILQEKNEKYLFAGKTGTNVNNYVGWFIGYILKENNSYTFVTMIEGKKEATGKKAKEITKKILSILDLM